MTESMNVLIEEKADSILLIIVLIIDCIPVCIADTIPDKVAPICVIADVTPEKAELMNDCIPLIAESIAGKLLLTQFNGASIADLKPEIAEPINDSKPLVADLMNPSKAPKI
jgi:hypothetical protein